MVQTNCKKICTAILRGVPERQNEILERRFGLAGQKAETLKAIGRDFGITRERVRQIEADALRRVKKSIQDNYAFSKTLDRIFRDWDEHLKSHGDLRAEKTLLAEISGPGEARHVSFLLTIAEPFEYVKETDEFYSIWTRDASSVGTANQVISSFAAILTNLGRTVEEQKLPSIYKKEIKPEVGISLTDKALFSYLDITKRFARGPHGLWGLREWPEITPRGLRDRAYLVYKKEARPLHFTEVARLISHYGFIEKDSKVLDQSMHNDLIRDPRFVLVGRGMYALQEWGYTPGTVREVIASVLRDAVKPLAEKGIIARVLKQRFVKASTVSLNLKNKQYFTKTSDGKYTLKPQLV